MPHAARERDAEAKRFDARTDAAILYVYRDDVPIGSRELRDSVLYVSGRLIGATLSGTYFRIVLRPGEHQLYGYGHDQGELKIRTRYGGVHFVSLSVENGTSRFAVVSAEKGKRDIARCCVLLENWERGQRPLLQ